MPAQNITRLTVMLLFWLLVLSGAREALQAQDVSSRARQKEKLEEAESARHGLTPGLEAEFSQDLEFDYGGIFSFTYSDYNDMDGTHVRRDTDVWLWNNLVYKDTYQAYARFKGNWKDYNPGSENEATFENENESTVPRVDVMYGHTNLSRALGIEDYGRADIRGGRDYFKLGSGMVLDKRGEGGRFEYKREEEGFSLTAFAMRSIKSEDGLDRSYPDLGHDKRNFSGLEATQELARELEIFGYTMFQRFDNRKHYEVTDGTTTWVQTFGQDSDYYGVGVRGEIGPEFTYSGEYVIEDGTRYSWQSDEKTDVSAHAYTLKSTYTFRTVESQPAITAQYLVGSGDGDAGNTVDTEGGNVAGTDYKAFTEYGYVNTGLAFFPRLANLKIVHVGANCTPFKDHELFGELEAGIDGFQYRRNKSNGGVSDRQVIPGHGFLGRELDLYTIWRPYSDFSIMTQYGYFWPASKAFQDDTRRYFFSVTVIFFF